MQSLCEGQEGEDPRATLAGGLLLLWVGQTLARGGRYLYGPVRVHDGPIDSGALAGLWAVGASDAPADVAHGRCGALPSGRRFVVIDASSMQAPGATGTDHRLHIAMDLLALQFLEVLVSDVHTGETLKHFTFAPSDVAVADRGYAQCQGMSAALQQGADLIVRLNPFSVVLGDATGVPLELCAALKRQRMETLRTLVVTLRSTGGQHEVRGWGQAYRLHAEPAKRARQKCRQACAFVALSPQVQAACFLIMRDSSVLISQFENAQLGLRQMRLGILAARSPTKRAHGPLVVFGTLLARCELVTNERRAWGHDLYPQDLRSRDRHASRIPL